MRREIKFRAWNGRDMNYSPDLITPEGKLSPKGIGWLIIMQFTGLHDKNGKEIYQSDLVRIKDSGVVGEVVWFNLSWQIKDGGMLCLFSPIDLEVVGNIYEHK